MNKDDTAGSNSEPQPDPDSTTPEAGASERGPERWIDRLKAAVGIKPAGTIREDLADALAAEDVGAGFSPEERVMIANILRLREVRVDDVMVPRADIDAIDIGVTLGELFIAFQKSGHSRMPVYRETLDDPVGLVHIKDLMGYITGAGLAVPETNGRKPETNGRKRRTPAQKKPDLRKVDFAKAVSDTDLVRNILFVPPSMPVTALLASMQATRMQMALVIDEYGGTDGLVSLEDVVEMVVGDIEDEHDDESGAMIVQEGEGMFVADARADLDEVAAAVGADFAPGEEGEDVDTVGGLVVGLLGRVPVRGELVTVPGGFEFEILDADPRRIKRLRIYRRPEGAPRPEPRRRTKPPSEPTAGA